MEKLSFSQREGNFRTRLHDVVTGGSNSMGTYIWRAWPWQHVGIEVSMALKATLKPSRLSTSRTSPKQEAKHCYFFPVFCLVKYGSEAANHVSIILNF